MFKQPLQTSVDVLGSTQKQKKLRSIILMLSIFLVQSGGDIRSASASCQGSTPPCSHYTIQANCTPLGCTWTEGQCSGASMCIGQATKDGCDAISGCTWIPGSCGGTVTPCESITTQTQCQNQPGCAWS